MRNLLLSRQKPPISYSTLHIVHRGAFLPEIYIHCSILRMDERECLKAEINYCSEKCAYNRIQLGAPDFVRPVFFFPAELSDHRGQRYAYVYPTRYGRRLRGSAFLLRPEIRDNILRDVILGVRSSLDKARCESLEFRERLLRCHIR